MGEMILKMSLITALMCLINCVLCRITKNRSLNRGENMLIGVVFGLAAVMSTHFGIDYQNMVLNVRDIAPLSAGLFFGPTAGITAGIIGGGERFIVGNFFDVGAYTTVACSVSTFLAGVISAAFRKYLFKGRKPSVFYAFFIGSVTEVFHMFAVLLTHRDDINTAFKVVDTCAVPMIIFTGIGMCLSAFLLSVITGNRRKWGSINRKDVSITVKFQTWMFLFIVVLTVSTFFFFFSIQTRQAQQNARSELKTSAGETVTDINMLGGIGSGQTDKLGSRHIGETGKIYIADKNGVIVSSERRGENLADYGCMQAPGEFFDSKITGVKSYCISAEGTDFIAVLALPYKEVYLSRDISAYETAFADILLFTLVFVLMYILVQKIIVVNLDKINASLRKITGGNLNEVVEASNSAEFISLSRDINATVATLKRYIEEAETRIDEELEFARAIQKSAVPQNFSFPGRDEFEVSAVMDAAREVGGDFYDLFFVDKDKIALVMADVSGKGIPAAMFMMRSKATVKGLAEAGLEPAEILIRANGMLCEGNDAEMFVTLWLGILDLKTGKMLCANAGHEYPALRRANGEYELFKDKHGLVLGGMEGLRYKQYEIDLEPGDRIFLYTDGVPEANNDAKELFGTDRMLEALNSDAEAGVGRTIENVMTAIVGFCRDADQFDDITMMCFNYLKRAE